MATSALVESIERALRAVASAENAFQQGSGLEDALGEAVDSLRALHEEGGGEAGEMEVPREAVAKVDAGVSPEAFHRALVEAVGVEAGRARACMSARGRFSEALQGEIASRSSGPPGNHGSH